MIAPLPRRLLAEYLGSAFLAALEASVSAATASRKEPVSVSDAKAARAERAEKAEKAKPAARRSTAKAKSDEDEEAAASGSRRKRKSA